jgi:Transposase DDE domain
MATFSAAMVHVKEHLKQCIPEERIFGICRELGHKWRNRKTNPAIAVQLLLLQLLAHVALRGLRHVAGISVSAQAICAARMRLPVQLFSRLIRLGLPEDYSVKATYRGLKTYLVDGMSFLIQDTTELAGKFGKASNQRGTSRGYPTPKLLTLMEAGAGFIGGGIILPYARQEFTCLSRLFKLLDPRSLLMGDRGLVSFTHMALLMARGVQGCFRLPRTKVVFGRGKGSRRLKKRLGRQDWLVTWTASRRPSWMSNKRWSAIAQQTLELRQISFRVCRKGFRTNWAWIITTLVDPKENPAQELVELYSQRWQIEVYFRDLKCTLKMRSISARTVKGVQKEVMAFILLYNLIRKVMLEAAQRQGVEPDRISFVDAALWLLYAAPGTPLPDLIVNPRRQRNTQPRTLKKGRRRFPPLRQSRKSACKPRCQVKI